MMVEIRTDRTLTVAQIAFELAVTTQTVRRWIADGELEAVRLGDGPLARFRVRQSALDAFVRPALEEAS